MYIKCASISGSPSSVEGAESPQGVSGEYTNYSCNRDYLRKHRRQLRREMTIAEAGLWKIIQRDQVDGYRFRRQYSIENFILDFYCPKLRLAIELDGAGHTWDDQPEKDRQRDQILAEQYDIETLRFGNEIVFERPWRIVSAIRKRAALLYGE